MPASVLGEPDFIDRPGFRMAYRCGGDPDGRPVILLHGLMDHSASFEPMVSAWAANNDTLPRFIAPDWRGHGQSGWTPGDYLFAYYLADLQALIDALVPSSGPLCLVGHSMGGQAASLYAGIHPARVSHLVLLDSLNVPDSDPADTPERYRDWLATREAPPRPRSYADINALARRIAKRYPELSESQHVELARLWSVPAPDGRLALHVDPAHRRRSPYGFRLAEARTLWQAVEAHTLMLDGGVSPTTWFVDEASMQARRACFARHRRQTLAGLGHFLHWQAPDQVAPLIAAFLRT